MLLTYQIDIYEGQVFDYCWDVEDCVFRSIEEVVVVNFGSQD